MSALLFKYYLIWHWLVLGRATSTSTLETVHRSHFCAFFTSHDQIFKTLRQRRVFRSHFSHLTTRCSSLLIDWRLLIIKRAEKERNNVLNTPSLRVESQRRNRFLGFPRIQPESLLVFSLGSPRQQKNECQKPTKIGGDKHTIWIACNRLSKRWKRRSMSNRSLPVSVPREVGFTKFSELVLIPKDEQGLKWYNSQEKAGFHQELVSDVRRLSGELERTGSEVLTPKVLLNCMGIEVLVTRGLLRRKTEQKRMHIHTVLSEQQLQRRQGISDPEKLSRVAKQSSTSSAKRARKLQLDTEPSSKSKRLSESFAHW